MPPRPLDRRASSHALRAPSARPRPVPPDETGELRQRKPAFEGGSRGSRSQRKPALGRRRRGRVRQLGLRAEDIRAGARRTSPGSRGSGSRHSPGSHRTRRGSCGSGSRRSRVGVAAAEAGGSRSRRKPAFEVEGEDGSPRPRRASRGREEEEGRSEVRDTRHKGGGSYSYSCASEDEERIRGP